MGNRWPEVQRVVSVVSPGSGTSYLITALAGAPDHVDNTAEVTRTDIASIAQAFGK
jgi:ethanolamine utilization microcompartment shell protein EutL